MRMPTGHKGRILSLTLCLGAVLVAASCESGTFCGPGTKGSDQGCVPVAGGAPALLPAVQSVTVSSLALETAGQPLYVLYPVRVTGALSIAGEELSTDVTIALESASAGTGCVLGAGVTLTRSAPDRGVYVSRPAERLAKSSDVLSDWLNWPVK